MRVPPIRRAAYAAARVALPLVLAGCGVFGQSDTASPIEQVRRGEYARAAAELEAMVEAGDLSAPVVESLLHAWTLQGEYREALERFEAWAAQHPDSGPIRLAAARAHRLTGGYAEALAHLDAIGADDPVAHAARHERAVLLDLTGRRDESQALYADLVRSFQSGEIGAGPDLLYAARALWALEQFHDANDLFRVIVEGDPGNVDALVAWGDMLAEKYQDPEAASSYEDALAIDPNRPEAHVGLARVLANGTVTFEPPPGPGPPVDSEEPAVDRTAEAIDRALEVNPNLIDAHLFVAERAIDAEQYEDADEAIQKALAVNPRSTPALALLATTHFLREETAEFERYVRQVLDINPVYGDMYYTLAERCVSVRLYQEAVDFAREAIRLNPRHWEAYSLMGINLLRVGDEEGGKAALETAYENDQFNTWTVNTLTLLDSYDNFETFETEHFRVRLHREERAVLAPYVADLLERAYTTLSAKYGFAPEGPITFEMFRDHADFAVRTLGLPGLSALGVSFGKVVVMDSPSARPPEEFNWGGTLWHEFTHVITLQMTDHKIPRWFSEGLSVFEERRGVPGWGDDLQPGYLTAIREGEFLPISELNNGFVRPTHPSQVPLSYYQASLVCEFIEERYGFDTILQMLALYRDSRSTEEVFGEALGMDLEAFDREFGGWVDLRVAFVDTEQFQTLTRQGREALEAGDLDGAIESLSGAIDAFPDYTGPDNAYVALAEAYEMRGDAAAAIETLERFTNVTEYAYSVYLDLARLQKEAGDIAGAAETLERAMYIHPMDLEGHRQLGQALLELERYDDAAREYGALLALDAPDRADVYYRLASAQYGAGRTEEARRSVLESLKIAPSYEAAQELLLRVR